MDPSAARHTPAINQHAAAEPERDPPAVEDCVVAVDIGTTKVCAVVGRRNDLQQMEILGHASVPCDGVQRGVVVNIHKTTAAISSAVERAARLSGVPIASANVGIAGQHISSSQNYNIINREDHTAEITQADLDTLTQTMRKLPLKPGEAILHIIAQDYSVDDEWGIDEPIGMCGGRLGANFHIITCQNAASANIVRAAANAQLEVNRLMLEPIASAASVLTEADKRDGVALVDIGGGTTDITIFADGRITHTCVIPFGGDVVTSDIRQVFRITLDDAERLKTSYGNAINAEAEDRVYLLPNRRGSDHTEIEDHELAGVIEARVTEILNYVDYQITASNARDRLQGGIVLTGGGSLLRNIDRLAELHTGIPTRIGFPVEHLAQGYPGELSSPVFATAIGLLVGADDSEDDATSQQFLRQTVNVNQFRGEGVNGPSQVLPKGSPGRLLPTPDGTAVAKTATASTAAGVTGGAAAAVATAPDATSAAAPVAATEVVSLAPSPSAEPTLGERASRGLGNVLDRVKEWFDGEDDVDLD